MSEVNSFKLDNSDSCQPTATLANYSILEELGTQKKRKFGNVFLGRDNATGNKIIVKRTHITEPKSIQQKQLESERKFTFDEKGLPSILDIFEEQGNVYLVKNYQDGIPIDDYWKQLKRKQQLPFLIDVVEKIIELLAILHSKQIYHCDLKPSNILVHLKEDEPTIELIDFGLAIQQPIDEKRKLIFPLGYAAPELILNKLSLVNETTDYFSLAILIWRLFSGKIPFSHPNPSIYTNLQLVHPLPDNNSLPKGMIKILNNLCRKATFKTAPNRMNIEDVDDLIIVSQKHRKDQYNTLLAALKHCNTRPWYYF